MSDHPSVMDRLRLARTGPSDWVTPEHLNVAPQLLGAPLARPGRRLVAIGIDVLLVAMLSDLGNLWLLGALAAVVLMHPRVREGDALQGRWRWFAWAAAAALLTIGVQQAWVDHLQHPERPARHATQDDDETDPAARAAAFAAAPDRAASAFGVSLSAEQRSALRIAVLEGELAAARKPPSFDLKKRVSAWADDVGLGLGWALAYFTLLPAWWNGQTLGKRLLGLRVVELTGKPLTVMRALKRYGGYAAGMATGLLGFAQVLWDSNRQAIQDKTAHTVVVDLRRAARQRPAAAADRTLSPGVPRAASSPTDQELR